MIGPIRQYIYIKGVFLRNVSYLFKFNVFLGFIKYGLEQIVSLDINSHSLSIKNIIDLKTNVDKNENLEIAMHFDSGDNVPDDDELFFTDLNNFQVFKFTIKI